MMPGFTHMQAAQPVTFGHHCMAYVEMFARDLRGCRMRSGAWTRARWARRRSPDRLPDRPRYDGESAGLRRADAQFAGLACPTATSRWSSWPRRRSRHASVAAGGGDRDLVDAAFRFRELSDAFSTGSSIMPQKKNPDAAELVRAKTGRVFGHLIGLLTVMKGLPLTYSKDMQEDKEAVFDAAETLDLMLGAMTGMVRDMKVDAAAMKRAAGAGYSTATDLADWLVRELGLPFREANHVTGRAVALPRQEARAGEARAGRSAGDPCRHHR